MENERLLVKRAARGDTQAFETLMQAHQRRIYQLCLRMMGNPQDALDASQEAMLRIYRGLDAYKGQSSLSTWVYRITSNICLDELRKRKRHSVVSMEVIQEAGYEPEDTAAGPERRAESREDQALLCKAIARLPEEQRAAVVLRDVHGLSYEEIAKALDLNINTVKSRISRGRQQLRAFVLKDRELIRKESV